MHTRSWNSALERIRKEIRSIVLDAVFDRCPIHHIPMAQITARLQECPRKDCNQTKEIR